VTRATGGDDLEVLPVAVPVTDVGDDLGTAAGRPLRRTRRTAIVAILTAVVAVAGVVAVLTTTERDDPTADSRALVDAWARAHQVSDVADDAAIRVRILVPAADSDVAFRGLAAVRNEERDRLRALGTEVARIGTQDNDIRRTRDAVVRALDVRARRAGVAANYYTSGGDGTRAVESIERALDATTRTVERELARLRRRHPAGEPRPPAERLTSTALRTALGPLARATDGPVGTRLALNVDTRLTIFDPDVGATGRATASRDPLLTRSLVTLADGTVVAWAADDSVRVVDAGSDRPRLGRAIAHGRPIPTARAGRMWIATGYVVTQVSVDGTTIAGPFRQPVDQVVAAIGDDALVGFDPGDENRPPTTSLWTPSDDTVRALAPGIFLAASTDRVATETCTTDAGCTLHVTGVATGATRDVPLRPGVRWSFGSAAISPDGRWLAAAARTSGLDGGLLFVDLGTLAASLVPARAVIGELPAGVTWDADSTRVFAANERGNGAMWAAPHEAVLHAIRIQVAYDDLIRIRDVVPLRGRDSSD
jgi:hypothetical protein